MRVNAIFMIQYSMICIVISCDILKLVEFITLSQFHSDFCGVTLTDIQLSLSSRGLFLCQVIKNHRRVLSSGGEALPPRCCETLAMAVSTTVICVRFSLCMGLFYWYLMLFFLNKWCFMFLYSGIWVSRSCFPKNHASSSQAWCWCKPSREIATGGHGHFSCSKLVSWTMRSQNESRHCLCELVVLKMLYLVLSRTVEYGWVLCIRVV